ncbi:MAG: ATP-binding protein [Chloroflexota bacterium]
MNSPGTKPGNAISLRAKLLLLYALTGLAAILVTSVLSFVGAIQGIRASAPSRASSLADELAYGFEVVAPEIDIFSVQRMVEKSASLENVEMVFVTDQDGVIVAHSNKSLVGQQGDLDLIRGVIETDQVYQDVIDGRLLRFIRPLHGQAYTPEFHDTTGVLWIELDLSPSLAQSIRAVGNISIVSAILVILTIGIAYSITKANVTDRLQAFSHSVALVEAGDLTANVTVTSSFGSQDEISTLATHFNKMVSSLDHRITFEELVSSLSITFSSLSRTKLDTAINDALRLLSSFIGADRSYIFQLSHDGLLLDNTYEWCAAGISPQMDNLQGVPVEAIPWWMGKLKKSEEVNIPRVADLPEEASTEKEILEAQDIQSVLVVPMMSIKKLVGFIGFDAVNAGRSWSKEEVRLLRMAADIISNAMVRIDTQKELESQRDFALLVMNTIGQGLIITDLKGVYDYVNPAFARMLGYSPEDLIGNSTLDYVHPGDLDIYLRALEQRTQGFSTSYEMRLIASNGNIIHTLATGSPRRTDDLVTGSVVVITDLTEIFKAKEALAQSEARLRAFLDAVPDLIFRMDHKGTFLDFKAMDYADLYVSPDKILGAPIEALLPAEVARLAYDAIEKALQTFAPQMFEYKLPTESGTKTYEARFVASTKDEVIVVVHDISEHVRLEQMKTDFINRASHELRTPLTTALLMVELLDGQDSRPNEWAEYWDILKQELNRERLILEDVLMVGRLESGRYKIAAVPLSVRPPLQGAIQAVQPQAEMKNISINLDMPDQIPDVLGSDEAFSHIFMNILSNAIKFSQPDREVNIQVREDDGGIRIQVEDQGVGIPSEDLPHLTSRFFRATNATEQEIPGSGIGLYIVKSIVEELGGQLKIASQLNVGTTVSIWLPAIRPVQA